ncbi:MAG: hypothetical protein ACD_54C00118G0002 [uncultured bacterium]|nr:MAG: hypothetical protein ACD_54C00118G0002 [uncultured bacterium]
MMEQILLKGKPIRLAVLDYGLFEVHHGARLMRLAQDRDALVIFGHSPQQWPGLHQAPAWFT